MSNSVYQIVTQKIIEKLKTGTVPWRKSWNSLGLAVSWKTGKPYRGLNQILLDPGEYLTFRQISEAGGKVKKGAKSQIVIFWKMVEKIHKDPDTGERVKITFPLLRYYRVFEINQVEGIKAKNRSYNHSPVEEAQKIVEGYKGGPKIKHQPGEACYWPALDMIAVPPIEAFPVREHYYSTLFHEMIHSTGHSKRLNRPGIANFDKFASEQYSKEELIAELGAAMLCATCGLDNTLDDSAAYINGWLSVLQNDMRLIITASSQAQKAVDWILGSQNEEEESEDKNVA